MNIYYLERIQCSRRHSTTNYKNTLKPFWQVYGSRATQIIAGIVDPGDLC